MAILNSIEWQAQLIRLILAILGAVLLIAGWARFASL
jgi:hypothetical protein